MTAAVGAAVQPRAIYLASRYSNQALMRMVRDEVVALGHTVTSTWIDKPITPDDDARLTGKHYTVEGPDGTLWDVLRDCGCR